MKRKELLPLFFFAIGAQLCLGQINTFPTTGNVGIGTTTLASKLQMMDELSVHGRNVTLGVSNFGNGIQLVGPSRTSIIFNPGQLNQLMLGFHTSRNIL